MASKFSEIDWQKYPILYVDDEAVACEIFKDNFDGEFNVFTAQSGAEALRLLEGQEIALVLADQRMPGMTGTELFAKIQHLNSEIVRILVTGYVDLESVIAAINAGHVYHYVEKPWDDAELRVTIKRALERFHLVRERDRLEQEKLETLEKMARSNRLASVGTLAAGIAHEIRNPLSAIITFHQMLPEKIAEIRDHIQSPADLEVVLEDEFWDRFAQIPLREVERIKKLVQELLDFSRQSAVAYNVRPTDWVALVEGILPIIESDLRRKGITLKKEFPSAPLMVDMDADKMKQVVINLLLNAQHAMPDGGDLTLMLRPLTDALDRDHQTSGELVVVDSGCGIDSQNLERVFDPFFTTRSPGLGTGLGLTMCHHIVTNHGGDILLHSVKGRGTRVVIRLNLASQRLALSRAPVQGPLAQARQSAIGAKVL